MTLPELRERVCRWLNAHGHPTTVDPEGDLMLSVGAQVYFLRVYEAGPTCTLLFPNFWHARDHVSLVLASRAACEVNARVRFAKLYVRDHLVQGVVDLPLPDADTFGAMYPSALENLTRAAQMFVEIVDAAQTPRVGAGAGGLRA